MGVGEAKLMEEKRKEFLDKHKPLKTEEEVEEVKKESQEAQLQYSKNIAEVESNLMFFLKREYPLKDPISGKAIAWIRQVPYREMREMAGDFKAEEIDVSKLSEEELLAKMGEKEDLIFQYMETLITRPKHTAEEWKGIASMKFIKLFDARLTEIFSETTEKTDFF